MKDEEEECGRKTPSSRLCAVMSSFHSKHELTSVSRNTCSELAVSVAY